MTITVGTTQRAKYFPELLPDTNYITVAAGNDSPLLDLRRFNPLFLHLRNISVEQTANAQIQVKGDDLRRDSTCDGMPDQIPTSWDMIGTEFLKYMIYSPAVGVVNFRTYFNLLVYEPSIAHLVKQRKSLTSKQAELAEKYGVINSVEKGLLPLPFSFITERQYQVVDEATYTFTGPLSTINTIINTLAPRKNEFLVLTKVSSAPGLVADNVQIIIDRDSDPNYLQFPTYPLALTMDLPCFIPAMDELRIIAVASGVVASHTLRYTVQRVRINRIILVRFGLVSEDEAKKWGDVWDKVKCGVL